MLHGDDLMIRASVLQIRILPGSLQRSLHRLRTGVGEKDPIHAGNRLQLPCRLNGRHIVIVVGGVNHLVDLAFQRVIVFLVLIAQGEHRNTRTEIQIFFAFPVI